MPLPDAANHNTDPAYLKGLVDSARKNRGIKIVDICRLTGIARTSLYEYTRGKVPHSYSVQFMLECLAVES